MVCSRAASSYLLSNYILVDVNRFNRRDCDVNPDQTSLNYQKDE